MFILIPAPAIARTGRCMHQALRVPEILLIIFKYVADDSGEPLLPTLAAIARTCRSFQHHVEEILWYKLPSISALYHLLPPRVRDKQARSWSLSRRTFSGPDWERFMERAGRIRVLRVDSASLSLGRAEWCPALLLAIATLRDPPLLTPGLRTLEWQTNDPFFGPIINLCISPSLLSLEVDAKLLIHRSIRAPLGDICPKLERLKINGNGRSAAGAISSVLRGLHCLETVICSTLDNDAFVHLAQLKRLAHLSVDMRWSVLNLDALRDRLCSASFRSLKTLYWKDYDLDSLGDVFLMPDVCPCNVHLEIESFCTSPSLRTFLHSFAAKFPHVQAFSLVHDVGAGRRFGLQTSGPGREHRLEACDLRPLFVLRRLRVLNLVDLGHLQLDDGFIKTVASTWPELEQLHLGTNAAERTPSLVTFDGLLSLLRHCPRLRSLQLWIDAEEMLSFRDTTVRHDRVTHLRLEGAVLGSRRAEVDGMLRRVLPGLRTIEESLDGVTRRVREVSARGSEEGASRTSVEGGRAAGRRTRRSVERGLSG